jgi:hypothetical protein
VREGEEVNGEGEGREEKESGGEKRSGAKENGRKEKRGEEKRKRTAGKGKEKEEDRESVREGEEVNGEGERNGEKKGQGGERRRGEKKRERKREQKGRREGGLGWKKARQLRGRKPLTVTVIGDAAANKLLTAAHIIMGDDGVETAPKGGGSVEQDAEPSHSGGRAGRHIPGSDEAVCEVQGESETLSHTQTKCPECTGQAQTRPEERDRGDREERVERQPQEETKRDQMLDKNQNQDQVQNLEKPRSLKKEQGQNQEESQEKRPDKVEQKGQSGHTKPFSQYLINTAMRGKAGEFSEKLQRYCRVERAGKISLEQATHELGQCGQLNHWARLLETALADPTPLQWVTLFRRLVANGSSKGKGVPSLVHPQLNKARLELALEWVIRSPAGEKLTEKLLEKAKSTENPCRSFGELLNRALVTTGDGLALELEGWVKKHMPIPSFAQWIGTTREQPPSLNNKDKADPSVETESKRETGPKGGLEAETNTHAHQAQTQENSQVHEPAHRELDTTEVEGGANRQPDKKLRAKACRLVTLNVNSLVASVERRGLMGFLESDQADIYALQETMVDPHKTQAGRKWRVRPLLRLLREWGYLTFSHAGERNKAGYGGTMFLTKARPEAVVRGTGDPEIDCEGRFLTLVYKEVIIVNSYAPTLGLDLTGADRKTKFWEAACKCKKIVELQNKYPGRRLLWVGDLNTARTA